MKRHLLCTALACLLTAPATFAASGAASPAVDHLAQALRLQTISYQDRDAIDYSAFTAFHRFLEDTYPGVHRALRRDVIADYSLLYTWPGTDPALEPVLFDAHYDVVPVEPGTEEEWTHPPFSGEVADGYLWGRGALDDKSTVIATMEAIESMLAAGYRPRRTLLFSVAHDEEIGGREGAANIAAHLAGKGVKLAYMVGEGGIVVEGNPMLPDRPMAMVSLAEKTYATLTLVARGEGGHSSMPVQDNAIVSLSRALATLQDNPFEPELVDPVRGMLETLGEEVGGMQGWLMTNTWLSKPLLLKIMAAERDTQGMVRSTTGITMFNAGVKENVIPQVAEAKVNFRLLPGTSVDDLIASVEKLIDDPRIGIRADTWKTSPPVADADAPAYATIANAIRAEVPDVVVTPALLSATTDTPHYRDLAPNIYRFHPITVGMDQTATIHGTDERIALDSIERSVAITRALVRAVGDSEGS